MSETARERLLSACRVAAVVLTTASFWYVPGFLFAEGYSKLPFFAFGVVVLFAATVWLGVKPQAPDHVGRAVCLSWFAFATAWVFAAAFGIDMWGSVFGSQVRQSGGVVLFHMILLFFSLVVFVRRKKDWQWVWWLHGCGGVLATVAAGGALLFFSEQAGLGARAWFGNPLLFSGTVLLSFFTFALAGGMGGRRVRVWVVGGMGMTLLGSLLGSSRSVILGIVAGGALGVFLYLLLRVHRKHAWWQMVVAGVLLAASLVAARAVFLLPSVRRVVGAYLPISRFLQPVQELRGDSSRIDAWMVAWEGFRARPVFGWGPEQFGQVFDERYPASFFRFSLAENFWDKSHNMFLEWLVSGGLPLFVAGLFLFGVLVWAFLIRFREGAVSAVGAAAGVGGLGAVFVYSFFVFETFFFWMFLVLLSAYLFQLRPGAPDALPLVRSRFRLWLMWVGVVLLLLGDLWVFGVGGVANVAAQQVVSHVDAATRTGIPAVAEQETRRAVQALGVVRWFPHPYRAELTRQLLLDFLNQEADGRYDEPVTRRMLPLFFDAVRTDRDAAPERFDRQFVLAQVAVRAVELGNTAAEAVARDAMAAALRISPQRQPVLLLAARLDMHVGDFPAAIASITEVVASVPDKPQPRYFLILAYLAAQDTVRAGQELVLYLDRGGTIETLPEVEVMADALASSGQFDRALGLYAHIASNPYSSPEMREAFVLAAQRFGGMTEHEARAALEQLYK